MLIADGHLDLSMNALQWNRDLLSSVYTIRAQEAHTPGKGRGQNTVALPEMRRGRIALSFATLIARSTGQPAPHLDFATQVQAYGIARGQLAYYQALERSGTIRIIRDTAHLDGLLDEWTASIAELATWIRYSPPPPDAKPVEPWFDLGDDDDEGDGGPEITH